MTTVSFMPTSTFLRTVSLMALAAVVAFAADVTGSWTARIGPPDGDGFELTYVLKQSGATLTGTIAGPQGDPLDITEGKVEGDNVSFNVAFNDNTFKYTGVVAGDEIKMTIKSDAGEFPGGEVVLKRSK
jgi:hypothetical protein